MSSATLAHPPYAGPSTVPKTMPEPEPSDPGKAVQVNLKLTGPLAARFLAAMEALGQDRANFARNIIAENLYIYEERARRSKPAPDKPADE